MENLLVPYQHVSHIEGSNVLVFAPHPDDEVFGCGGSIRKHVESNIPVRVVIASDGAYGLEGDARSAHALQRQNESRLAAKILGYGDPEFWGIRDREVRYNEQLVCQILETIRDADLVYAPSIFEMHPDHRMLGMATVEAVRRYGRGIKLALYEVGIPLRPNVLLDISSFAERKRLAMECFASQNAIQRYDLDIAALNRFRSYTLPASVTAAEAYMVVTAEELAADPFKIYQSEYQKQRELGLSLDSHDIPLVSVIIRSMDRPTLAEALDSVALQTYPNIEVVVVSAKGPGHRKIGTWCGRFPLRFIDSDKPLRRSRAANCALEVAHGEYMIFLDDDDWFMPDHVSVLVNALTQNPDKKVAYSCVICTDEKKAPIDKTFSHPFDRTRLLVGNFIPIHAALFSRAIIDARCRMDESLDLYEDWDFWLQASAFGDFVFVNHFSAAYRFEGQSGQGCRAEPTVVHETLKYLLSKWAKTWRQDDLWDIMIRVVGYEEKTEEIANLQQRYTGLPQYSELQQQHSELQQQHSELQQQHSELQQSLNIILHSRSWRLSAPLRNTARWLKKLIPTG